MARAALLALASAVAVAAIDDGLARTPVMGWNSWTAFGSGVTAADLQSTADFFVSSGLAAAGYLYVSSDDGWSLEQRDNASGRIVPDPAKFPAGIAGVAQYVHARGLKLGIYSAASSVVCSGRPGSLFNEALDAETFAAWGVDLVKYDNCGEYSYGSRRFDVFADAVAAAGRPMVLSTEPFALLPNPLQARFAHYSRTGNDISADWPTILDRIDRNDKWSDFAGPGHFNDPDMLQVGNGHLTLGEQRAHFALWSLAKAPLLLATNVQRLSAESLAIVKNAALIAVNQDALGIQARKLAVNGSALGRLVGLVSCFQADFPSSSSGMPGPNGATAARLVWQARPLNGSSAPGAAAAATDGSFMLGHNASGRCLGLRPYAGGAITPQLLPCDASDATQAWRWPAGAGRIGGLQSVWAVTTGQAATVLSVANSTLFGAVHGQDPMPLLDAAYGTQVLQLAPYTPEPPCANRNCQGYDPSQSWYLSPRTGWLALAQAPANFYRVWYGPGYVLTSHLPATDELCLSEVASISNDGMDPVTATTGGQDVWGGPLAGGAFVLGLLNRDPLGSPAANVTARWSMLEAPGLGDDTPACVRELTNGTALGVAVGGIEVPVPPHDIAVLRIVPGASSC